MTNRWQWCRIRFYCLSRGNGEASSGLLPQMPFARHSQGNGYPMPIVLFLAENKDVLDTLSE